VKKEIIMRVSGVLLEDGGKVYVVFGRVKMHLTMQQVIALLGAPSAAEKEEPRKKVSVTQAQAAARRRVNERKKKGLCLWCDNPASPGKAVCDKHRAEKRLDALKRWERNGIFTEDSTLAPSTPNPITHPTTE